MQEIDTENHLDCEMLACEIRCSLDAKKKQVTLKIKLPQLTELGSMTTLTDARAAQALWYSEVRGPLQEGSCRIYQGQELLIFDNKAASTKMFTVRKETSA